MKYCNCKRGSDDVVEHDDDCGFSRAGLCQNTDQFGQLCWDNIGHEGRHSRSKERAWGKNNPVGKNRYRRKRSKRKRPKNPWPKERLAVHSIVLALREIGFEFVRPEVEAYLTVAAARSREYALQWIDEHQQEYVIDLKGLTIHNLYENLDETGDWLPVGPDTVKSKLYWGRRKEEQEATLVPLCCVGCGSTFRVPGSQSDRRYCTYQCFLSNNGAHKDNPVKTATVCWDADRGMMKIVR